MGTVPLDKFNLNQFYEKTPTALKYILVISLIIVSSYFLFSRKVTKGQDKELEKIEQTIETTYSLINKFEIFENAQYQYNKETMHYLKNIYTLVEELNENMNKKFDLLLSQGGSNTEEILDRLILLNESFDKLQEAYTPEPFIKPVARYPKPQYKSNVIIIPIDGNDKVTGDTIFTKKKKSFINDEY